VEIRGDWSRRHVPSPHKGKGSAHRLYICRGGSNPTTAVFHDYSWRRQARLLSSWYVPAPDLVLMPHLTGIPGQSLRLGISADHPKPQHYMSSS